MKRVKIIAEIGVNHNGSIKIAKKIIKKLSKLDIDYIKESILYNEVECDHSFCIGADNSVPYIIPNVANSKKYDYYIIYCDGEGCPYSYDLSIFLFENFNINNIFYYEEGIPVWKEKGLPTK